MTSIDYQDIFESFLGNVQDYGFNDMTKSEVHSLLREYLHKATSNIYVYRLFSSLTLDDEIETLTFEIAHVIEESVDADFVKTVLAKQMVYEWVHPQVRNVVNTAQMFGGSEQKFYAQANHLNELRALEEDTVLEVRRLIRDRNFIYNDYLSGS